MTFNRQEERERALKAIQKAYSYPEQVILLYDHLDAIRQQGLDEAQRTNSHYHIHGLCAILGYVNEKHNQDFWVESGRDFFQGNTEINLRSPDSLDHLVRAMDEDGATLINGDGYLAHSGRFIGVPIADTYAHSANAAKTYRQLKENSSAGTRHLAAVAASAIYPELSFLTVKSDHPELRIIKDGYIVHSTVASEVNHPLVVGITPCDVPQRCEYVLETLAA